MSDVNRDGEVNATDLVRMQDNLAGNDVEVDYPLLFVEYVGSGAQGGVGQPLAEAVGVRLQIVATWQPLQGMTVQFAIVEGNGSVQPSAVDTGAEGQALTQWALGTVSTCLGQDNGGRPVWECHDRLRFLLPGYAPDDLYAFAVPDDPHHLSDSWTEPSVSLIKINLYYYFNIHLYDQYDNPVPYFPIFFSKQSWPPGAAGQAIVAYDPSNYQTGRYGTSYPRITVGNRPGQYVFQALVQPPDGPPLTLNETVEASTGPAVVCFSSGNWQTGTNGQTLPNPYRFGAMEYVWSEADQNYNPEYFDNIWLDMSVVADPPSDPATGGAAPAGGLSNVIWGVIPTFQTYVTLPEVTQLPATAHVFATTAEPDFIAPFNQVGGGAYVVPDRYLKIYLDVDQSWETDHRDDSPFYLPGGKLMDDPANPGLSEPVPGNETDPIQTVRVMAAFLDLDGQFIGPPAEVTRVRLTLEETSKFRGLAMNYGANEDYDFQFAGGVQEIEVTFGPEGIAIGELDVFDYGGRTRIRASVNLGAFDIGIYGEETLDLPVDDDLNRLPDAGYFASGSTGSGQSYQIGADNLASDADIDDSPQATLAGGNVNTVLIGDGLTNYEEYRGFVCRGVHIRTHPQVKDFFFFKYRVDQVVKQILPDPDWVALGVGFMASSGLYVHDLDERPEAREVPRPNYLGYSVNFINRNYTNANGLSLSNHFPQRAVNVQFNRQAPEESLVHGVTTTRSKVADIPLNVSHCTIFVDRIEYMEDHTAGSIMAVDSAFRLNVYRYMFTHELGHTVHICHSDGSANPCTDNAVIDPAPTPPNDMFIMQSGLFPEANKVSVNPARHYPSQFHPNSNPQIRFRQ